MTTIDPDSLTPGEVKTKLRLVEQYVEKLEADLAEAQERLYSQERDIEGYIESYRVLSAATQAKSRRITELETIVAKDATVATTAIKQERKIEEQSVELDTYRKSLCTLRKSIREKDSRITELEDKIENHKQIEDELINTEKCEKEQIRVLREEFELMRNHRDNLKTKLATVRQLNSNQQVTIKSMQAKEEELIGENAELANRVNEMEERIYGLEQRLRASRNFSETYKRIIKDLEDKINGL